jgi:hypothetical protein
MIFITVMKNRLIEFALKFVIAIQLTALALGGTLAILEFIGRKDLVNKIVNALS